MLSEERNTRKKNDIINRHFIVTKIFVHFNRIKWISPCNKHREESEHR